jgi:hypothetical protein
MNFIKKYIYNSYKDFGLYPDNYEYYQENIRFMDRFPMYRLIENKIIYSIYKLRKILIRFTISN